MLTVTSSLTRDSSRLRNDLIAASPIGFYNFKRECPLGKSDHPLEVLQRWGSGRLILKYTVLSTNGKYHGNYLLFHARDLFISNHKGFCTVCTRNTRL
nr:unnamed protein product [Callosobruchus analis]